MEIDVEIINRVKKGNKEAYGIIVKKYMKKAYFVALGLVKGNTIRARHVGRDIVAGFRNIVGGEIVEYTKMLAESREQALDRMQKEAEKLGANAVVGMRFITASIMGGAAELLAYGTAVIVE